MNINLIFEKRKCNFDIPNNATIKYIKTLCSKIFKSPSLDICYKEINISNEQNETKKLKEIISKDEDNITLIVSKKKFYDLLKKTTFSTKNSSDTIDMKTSSEASSENKIFDISYSRKYKSLIYILKDINNKIIDIDNYLFRKTKTSNNSVQETMNTFEKRVIEFIEGLIIYYKKIIDTLNNINNCAKNDNNYKNFTLSLNQFYSVICFNDENEESNKEEKVSNNSPKNKVINQSQITIANKISRNIKNNFPEQANTYTNQTPRLPLINPNNIVIPLFLQEKEKEDEKKKAKKNKKLQKGYYNSETRKKKIPLVNVNEEKNEDTTESNKSNNEDNNKNVNENKCNTSRNYCTDNLKLDTIKNSSIDNIIHSIKKRSKINLLRKKEQYENSITITKTKNDEIKIKVNDNEEDNGNKGNNSERISKLAHDLTDDQKSPKKEKHCGFMLSTKSVCRSVNKNEIWEKMKVLNLKSRKDLDMKEMIRRQTAKKKVSKSLNKYDFLI